MKSGSIFDRLADGLTILSERQAVQDYKAKSEIYKNLLKAIKQPGVSEQLKHDIEKLADEATFDGMLKIIKKYSLEKESTLVKVAAKTVCTIGGYFSPEANAGYYALQLHDDIIAYELKTGYLQIDRKRNTPHD